MPDVVMSGAGGGVDPAEARDAARDILSGREYAEPEPSVLDRALDWLLDRLASFLGTLAGGGPGSVIGWIVVLALVLGATWLLARALQVPATAGADHPQGVVYGTESRRDPDQWLAEARRLEAAGDRRGALRCRYQALLAVVVREEVVDDVAGRTAREYDRLLAGAMPEVATASAELTSVFERTWYGGEDVAPGTLERFGRSCEAIEARACRRVTVR